uniref:Serpentine Receptor, class U n=1 Tax=Caenorhabditis tropicalis TaxID=1561998 RepID=A0A1I7SYB7_9PELO
MQLWNILMVTGEFLMFRIPYTSVFTRYCASEDPQILLKLIVFFFHWGMYTSQLFTVSFCALRVFILFSSKNIGESMIPHILSGIFIFIGFITSLPHLLSIGFCFQMYTPYPFGSIMVISEFHYYNSEALGFFNFLFTAVTTFSIIGLNVAMLLKIRASKNATSSIKHSKVERTLTGTVLVLLIPQTTNLVVGAAEMIRVDFFSYLLFIGSIAIDTRVHLVTTYFYFSHPVFQKEAATATVSVSQKSSAHKNSNVIVII